jgi:hypothetical protein
VSDGSGLAEALLGLPGFRVVAVTEIESELVVTIETIANLATPTSHLTRLGS